ncbi:D-alanyl-D-alanine carboxypeptidase family protein [Candidatus Omnitrophota bacterium]
MKRLFIELTTCLFILSCCSFLSFAESKNQKLVTAQSAILVDVTANRVLYSKKRHKKFAPASTIKVLTGLIAIEQLGLKKNVKISRKASKAEPTKVWLPEGAVYKSGDLINAVLISSANDASIAVAEAVSGSEWRFTQLMNKRAKAMGAKNSNFLNASGLPVKGQYSTVYDLYRIMKAAIKNDDVYNIMRTKRKKIKGTKGKTIKLVNHNKLLFKKSYPLVVLKTGYTKAARHCYVGKIYYNGRQYVFAFLKSRKPWSDINAFINLIKKKLKS